MSYSSIITTLQTKIAAISGVQACLTAEPKQFTVYPTVTIMPLGHTQNYKSFRDTEYHYSFVIRIYGQLDGTFTSSQIKVRDIADLIMDALNKDPRLGGTIDFSELDDGSFSFQQREAPNYVFDMKYKVSVLVARY